MATDEQNLSAEQKELVAVGASVGAGCQPCVTPPPEGGREGRPRRRAAAGRGHQRRARARRRPSAGRPRLRQLGLTCPRPRCCPGSRTLCLARRRSRRQRPHQHRPPAAGRRRARRVAASSSSSDRDRADRAGERGRIHLREAERLLDAVAPASRAKNDTQPDERLSARRRPEPERPSQRPGAGGRDPRRQEGCSESMPAHFGAAGVLLDGRRATTCSNGSWALPRPAQTNEAPATTPAADSCKKEI